MCWDCTGTCLTCVVPLASSDDEAGQEELIVRPIALEGTKIAPPLSGGLIAAECWTQYLNSCGSALAPDDLQAGETAVESHRQTYGARQHVDCTAAVRGHIVGKCCV